MSVAMGNEHTDLYLRTFVPNRFLESKRNADSRRWSHMAMTTPFTEQNRLVPVNEVSEKHSDVNIDGIFVDE